MKFGYTFSNLYGTVYGSGNLVFSKDGNSVYSPVGNRVSIFNLVDNTSTTLPCESPKDIRRMALSPNGIFLLTADVDGRALLINTQRRIVLSTFNFKCKVYDIQFSPCGSYFAVTNGKQIHVWQTPGTTKEFAPFVLHRKYTGHHDDVTCISWSHDSQFFVTGSKDATCRVYTLHPLPGYRPVTFTAHRDRITAVMFASADSLDVYTVSRDGVCLMWRHRVDEVLVPQQAGDKDSADEMPDKRNTRRRTEEHREDSDSDNDDDSDKDTASEAGSAASDGETDGATVEQRQKWSLTAEDKHYFLQGHNAKVLCAVLHQASGVLVVGFSNGVFALYEMPDFNNIHSLSVSQSRINSTAVNASGEWLAFGCSELGQLLVWEWQSETYVLKQQGHRTDMTTLAYSPDGRYIASGGLDGKVKLWSTVSGLATVTFVEHSAEITGTVFTQNGMVVLSASLDGTVRAFDLVRYRNFRTFTSPEPTQFNCLGVDPSGELVAAGCGDSFDICLWSMKTGRLLDILAGHEAPVSAVEFSPTRSVLASSSWDGSTRIWDIFEHKAAKDTLEIGSDVVTVAFRPDGRELACSSLNGQLTFFDVTGPANVVATIEGRKDVQGGRKMLDRISAANSNSGKCFTSLCYSADGTCMIAAGATKYVCIYELGQHVLLKRFTVSSNLSLDGVQHFLNSKLMGAAGSQAAFEGVCGDRQEGDSDDEGRRMRDLPGVTKGDFSTRRVPPEIRTTAVRFSPTGRSWAAATTAGLVVFSLDDSISFDPFELDIEVTPANVEAVLRQEEYTKALVMAFRLGEMTLAGKVLDAVPFDHVSLIARSVPRTYLGRLLSLLAIKVGKSRQLEFYLHWACQVCNMHGRFLKDNASKFMVGLRDLQRSLSARHELMDRLCNENKYALRFLLETPKASEMETDAAEMQGDAGQA